MKEVDSYLRTHNVAVWRGLPLVCLRRSYISLSTTSTTCPQLLSLHQRTYSLPFGGKPRGCCRTGVKAARIRTTRGLGTQQMMLTQIFDTDTSGKKKSSDGPSRLHSSTVEAYLRSLQIYTFSAPAPRSNTGIRYFRSSHAALSAITLPA